MLEIIAYIVSTVGLAITAIMIIHTWLEIRKINKEFKLFIKAVYGEPQYYLNPIATDRIKTLMNQGKTLDEAVEIFCQENNIKNKLERKLVRYFAETSLS